MKTVKVAAAVICDSLAEKRMVFATARGYGEYRGQWEFPGGKVEEGETSREALKREIREELDAEIRVGELLGTIEYDYPAFHLSMDCFWCEVSDGDLKLLEAKDARWLTRDTLWSVEWLPADKTIIGKVREQMGSGRIRFLEELASNGHVPLNMLLYDGWILRFSNGHTGRANSVSVLYPSSIPIEEKVPVCEAYYRKEGLPARFKLTELDDELDRFLRDRGYRTAAPTDVMVKELHGEEPAAASCVFSEKPSEEWLNAYFRFEEITDGRKKETFRKMLGKVLVDTVYCSVVLDGEIIAVASAAIERGYMLLHNVIVCEEYRGRGYGELLCRGLLRKAEEHGAKYAFLQVVKTNKAAASLYTKLGYRKEYTYWYMIKEMTE